MKNDRIEKLELITTRLMRRATKKTTALITPYPISSAVFGDKVEGPILRYMFPCEGVITKGIVKLGEKPKNAAILEVKIFNADNVNMKGFTLNRKDFFIEPNLSVKSGDCLEISIASGDVPITEVWISFLWKPSISDIEAKSFLIEELESDLLQKQKELTEP